MYPTGALIQEEALQMKERMVESVPDLDQFHLGIGDLSHSR